MVVSNRTTLGSTFIVLGEGLNVVSGRGTGDDVSQQDKLRKCRISDVDVWVVETVTVGLHRPPSPLGKQTRRTGDRERGPVPEKGLQVNVGFHF